MMTSLRVELAPYYLGVHLVTNGQYARFLSARRPKEKDLEKWILLDSNCFVRRAGQACTKRTAAKRIIR